MTVTFDGCCAVAAKDLDWDEIGGYATCSHRASSSRVEPYELYLVSDAGWPGGSIWAYTSEVLWPPEKAKELAEQATPVALLFEEKVALVTEIDFPDMDFDEDDSSEAENYMVYLTKANTSRGCSNTPRLPELNESNESMTCSDWCSRSFTHLAIYTLSSFVEQSTPMIVGFFDEWNLSFDYNLDGGDLFDDLFWEAPADVDSVLPKGAETPLLNYTHLLIYTVSPLVEQTTAVALDVFDAMASVSNLKFDDRVDVANSRIGVACSQVGEEMKPLTELPVVPGTPSRLRAAKHS